MSEPATDSLAPTGLRHLFNWRNSAPWLVLVFTLGVQLVIFHQLRASEERAAQRQFTLLVDKVTEAIDKRLISHEQILLGAAALFDASGEVSREEWHTYIARLRLPSRYPGIQGIGFSKALLPDERAAHVARMRAEGFANYQIHPPGDDRPLYSAIAYLEPFDERNQAAFGYDMLADPLRRQAMLRAAASGQSRITAKVTLMQETDGDAQAGTLIYVPVYRKDMPLGSPQERLRALRGLVYSAYRIDDLLEGILGAADLKLGLRIYASPSEQPEQLIYSASPATAARHSELRQLELHGQIWTLRLDSLPELEEALYSSEALIVALGIGLSLLLFLLTASLTSRHSHAAALARRMTEDARESKQALSLSEERLTLALKGSNDGLWDLDLQAGSFYASSRSWHMLGYRAGELPSDTRLWERVVVDEDLPSARTRLARAMLSTLNHFSLELRLRHKSGRSVPVLVRGYIQRDPAGKPLRFSGTLADLTEHKRIEERKNALVSTVSHELRTPLTSITGALGLITSGTLGEVPAPIQQMLCIAHRNSLRLGYLINDLLDMEKIAAGKMAFNPREHALQQLVEEALASNQAFAARLGVRFALRDSVDARVWVDGLRMQQVLTNLLSNAVKYTPEGGLVSVSCSVRDTQVRISVTDQGPGIAENFKARIFEKFATQSPLGDRRQEGSTGLGLAISKEFIERMGGTLGFESQEGQGTTFWCELPIQEQSSSAPDSRLPRLLVIEDEPDTGRLLHLMLRDAGYAVDRVQSLHLAREKLAASDYQAITLDMHLPDGSGRQLIEEIRGNPKTCDLPIIVISAANQFERKPSDRHISWLHKPISAAQLLMAVNASKR